MVYRRRVVCRHRNFPDAEKSLKTQGFDPLTFSEKAWMIKTKMMDFEPELDTDVVTSTPDPEPRSPSYHYKLLAIADLCRSQRLPLAIADPFRRQYHPLAIAGLIRSGNATCIIESHHGHYS